MACLFKLFVMTITRSFTKKNRHCVETEVGVIFPFVFQVIGFGEKLLQSVLKKLNSKFFLFFSEHCKQFPKAPPNGFVIAPYQDHNAKGEFGCKDGYKLIGSTYTYCHFGKWITKTTPVCQESKISKWSAHWAVKKNENFWTDSLIFYFLYSVLPISGLDWEWSHSFGGNNGPVRI